MLDFESFIESLEIWKPKLKLFGQAAERVTTSEMKYVFDELEHLIGKDFEHFELVKSLPSKKDHGDIDILVVGKGGIQRILDERLEDRVVQFHKNGNTNSFLFKSKLGKQVHVDLIQSANHEDFETKKYYYSLNDFSGIVGIAARKLGFKYGGEGFFKRFQDKKGIWHDLLITKNLLDGLKILGFDLSKYPIIKDHDDIVAFVVSSPLIDYNMFKSDHLSSRERTRSGKRSGLDYLVQKIFETGIHAHMNDEDYFLEKYAPQKYRELETLKKELNDKTYERSNKYNGLWIMQNFNLRPSPYVGSILKAVSDHFGNNLQNTDEQTVKNFISSIIKKV